MTAPIAAQPKEVRGTVERVERKEPPEPEGWIPIYYSRDSEAWYVTGGFFDSREDAERQVADPAEFEIARLVYTGAPLPSPTSDEIDQLLVDLRSEIDDLALGEDGFRIWRAFDALSDKLGRVTR